MNIFRLKEVTETNYEDIDYLILFFQDGAKYMVPIAAFSDIRPVEEHSWIGAQVHEEDDTTLVLLFKEKEDVLDVYVDAKQLRLFFDRLKIL